MWDLRSGVRFWGKLCSADRPMLSWGGAGQLGGGSLLLSLMCQNIFLEIHFFVATFKDCKATFLSISADQVRSRTTWRRKSFPPLNPFQLVAFFFLTSGNLLNKFKSLQLEMQCIGQKHLNHLKLVWKGDYGSFFSQGSMTWFLEPGWRTNQNCFPQVWTLDPCGANVIWNSLKDYHEHTMFS